MNRANSGPLLEVENLTVSFPGRRGELRAVNGMSYSLYPQRTLAIVGESGSGKTVSCRALMGLLPEAAVVTGSARFQTAELLGLTDDEMRRHRGTNLAMVFQDPSRSLNPTMKVGNRARLWSRRRRRSCSRTSGCRTPRPCSRPSRGWSGRRTRRCR